MNHLWLALRIGLMKINFDEKPQPTWLKEPLIWNQEAISKIGLVLTCLRHFWVGYKMRISFYWRHHLVSVWVNERKAIERITHWIGIWVVSPSISAQNCSWNTNVLGFHFDTCGIRDNDKEIKMHSLRCSMRKEKVMRPTTPTARFLIFVCLHFNFIVLLQRP